MKKTPSIKKIKCVIFQSKNETIERITKAINKAENTKEKATLAKKLLGEAEDLLSCKHFGEKRAECKICQYISKIRERTANLILKAGQIKIKK